MRRTKQKRNGAWTDATDRLQREVLRHIVRYRLMTIRGLRSLSSRGCPTAKSARRLLERMRQDRLIARAPLVRREPYYHLTAAGREFLGLDDRRTVAVGPLSERAKIRAFATLGFCCLGPERRQLLFREELAQVYPPLARSGRAGAYYLHAADGPPRLGLLRVDVGGHARWDRIVYKLLADAREHQQASVARELIDGGQFELSVVTTLAAKALRIGEALDRQAKFGDIHVRITAMPVLLQLVAPPPR